MEIATASMSENLAEKAVMRENILDFQQMLSEQDGAFFGDSDLCPVKHYFADGVYMREMFVPKDTVITGKIHNLSHVNILVSGTMEVATEDGVGVITGPCSFVTRAGVMKVGHSRTPCIWINVHPNIDNTQDIDELENRLVSSSHEDYQKFIELKQKQLTS